MKWKKLSLDLDTVEMWSINCQRRIIIVIERSYIQINFSIALFFFLYTTKGKRGDFNKGSITKKNYDNMARQDTLFKTPAIKTIQ